MFWNYHAESIQSRSSTESVVLQKSVHNRSGEVFQDDLYIIQCIRCLRGLWGVSWEFSIECGSYGGWWSDDGMISNDTINRDHIFQYTPCSPGSVLGNTALGTVFLIHSLGLISGTYPGAENIDKRPWEICWSLGFVFLTIHSTHAILLQRVSLQTCTKPPHHDQTICLYCIKLL